MLILVLAGVASAAIPDGTLLERPVTVAVLLKHAKTADEAGGALADLAKARFSEFAVVKEMPKALTGPLVSGAETAKGVFALSFLIDPARPAQYAQVCALSHALAEKLSAQLEDGDTRQVFTVAQWKTERLDTWQGTIPLVSSHVEARPARTEAPEGVELRGLRRFGLPDLVLEGVGAAEADAAASLLLMVAQQMVERPLVSGAALVVKPIAFQHAKMRTPRGGAASVKLVELKATPANPRRYGLAPEPAESASAMMKRLLKTLGGAAQEVAMPQHVQAALEAASGRAQARLKELGALWQKGAPKGAELLVKAPFPTASGGREWMWVEVTRWDAGAVSGKLRSAPGEGSSLNEGQVVTVSDAELFDYLYTEPGKEQEGGQTEAILDPAGKNR